MRALHNSDSAGEADTYQAYRSPASTAGFLIFDCFKSGFVIVHNL